MALKKQNNKKKNTPTVKQKRCCSLTWLREMTELSSLTASSTIKRFGLTFFFGALRGALFSHPETHKTSKEPRHCKNKQTRNPFQPP
jgi:hypothetical protein